MPTRIALKDNATTAAAAAAVSGSPRRIVEPRIRKGKAYTAGFMRRESSSDRGGNKNDTTATTTTVRTRNTATTTAADVNLSRHSSSSTTHNNKRLTSGFRSSILREFRQQQQDDDVENDDDNNLLVVTENVDDTRASPRLLGYLFSMIASAVLLVSVVQFYRQRGGGPEKNDGVVEVIDGADDLENDASSNNNKNKYYEVYGSTVYRWKLWGAIYASSAGALFAVLTILAHFDTYCFPQLWERVFRDGSLAERNWILFLTLFWAGAVHICTSTLSVGESQANVFFTTWIAFASLATNYGVWRESAGLPPLTILGGKKRETTYHWIWICLFSCIFAGAATDMYYNRDEIVLRYRGQPLDLLDTDWRIILSVVWSEVALCLIAIVLNETFENSWTLPCVMKRNEERYRCVFGWRQLEGFVILIATGGKFWLIIEYAGSDGVIAGLSNAYFGVWGSFFNGVFALGTWLRENKNIAYIVREGAHDEENPPSEMMSD